MKSEVKSEVGLEPWCAECPFGDLPSLNPLTEREMALIEAPAGARVARAGSQIIAARETPIPVYHLTSGRVLRLDTLPNGRQVILQVHFPGDLIGYGAALLNLPPHYSATALTEVTYQVLDRSRIMELFETAPGLARKLTERMALRDRTVDYRLLNLGWRPAEEQVAAMLLFAYVRLRRLGNLKDGEFSLGLSQEQIADFLGVHVTHVSRMMRRLRQAGLATLQRGEVHITDLPGLLRVGCFCAPPKPAR